MAASGVMENRRGRRLLAAARPARPARTSPDPAGAIGPAASPVWIAFCALLLLAPLGHAEAGPATTGDLLEQARAAAGQDRHADAVDAYREALALEPSLADSLAPALATQLTWSGRYAEALSVFRPFLERHRQRTDVWMTCALAEAWSGRTGDALASYRHVLALNRRDRGARLGEARMLAWMGRSDASLARYLDLVRDEPEWTDAWLGLAQLRNWTGRPDLALAALDQARQAGPENKDVNRMEQEIRGGFRPRSSIAFDRANDSDRFRITGLRLEEELPLSRRGHYRVGALRDWYDRPGLPARQDQWVAAAADLRLADPWLARGALSVQLDRPRGARYAPINLDLSGAWIPNDRLRGDFAWSHFTPFTFEVYPDRVRGDLVGAGITWHPPVLSELVLAGDRTWYSDDNDRVQARAEARWLIRPRGPRVHVSSATLYRDSRRWTGHGIWNPDRNRVHYGRGELGVDLGPNLGCDLFLEAGWGKEAAGPYLPYAAFGASAGWNVGDLRLEARAGHYGPYERTQLGYERSATGLSVIWRF